MDEWPEMIIRHLTFDIETTGLDPMKSRITCICARDSEGREFCFSENEEKAILKDFSLLFESNQIISLVSANGRDFDLPFILVRAFLNGFDYSPFQKIIEVVHFDIINDITQRKISLNNLARLYGFPMKNGNGLQAIELWKKGNIKDLINYCLEDVRLMGMAV